MNWAAVWPLALLLGFNSFFILAVFVFWARVRRHGMPVDERIDQRHSAVFGPFLMHYWIWLISPIERALIKMRVSPNALTGLSLVISVGAMWTFATGHFGLAGWLYIATGVVDIFDGRVARATGRSSQAGAFADSVLDRLAEGLIFAGLVWYYHQRSELVMLIVLAALISSFIVSYNRARGEGLGVKGMDVGGMQRPERIFILGVTSLLSPFIALYLGSSLGDLQPLMVGGLAIIALVSAVTSTRRFLFAYGALSRETTK